VTVAPAATMIEQLNQGVLFVPSAGKRELLATLLRDPAFERVLVSRRIEGKNSKGTGNRQKRAAHSL